MKEITEQNRKRLDELFKAFEIVSEEAYVYLCDMVYDYSRWSKSAVDTFGLPDEYMYGAGGIWEERIHPDDRESYHESIEAIFSGSDAGHDMQYRARRRDGGYNLCTCRGLVINAPDGSPAYFGGVIRNHDEQSHLDTLTGLRNQYGFFEDLRNHIYKKQKVRIVMVGISKFTEINEVFGYRFGNSVLQRFGRVLYEVVGSRGQIYRLDGTRFAIISDELDEKEVTAEYEEARSALREGIEVDGKQIIVEMNAGLLSLDNFAVNDQTVYSCLNFAYSESKTRKQGDLVEFYNDLNDENRERIEKLHVIRVSITQAYRGFSLHYQPVVDAQTQELTGAEALIRWSSPDYGMVAPNLFIPLLENDPLFPDLGVWILRTALADAKTIMEDQPKFVVNVNLSYAQIEKPGFTDMVKSVLKEMDFPANHLCLEITERCRLLDLGLLKNVFAVLRAEGVKFALDDFGTGFSSMGIVKNLPFDTIKIDASFVRKIEEDEKERELIEHFANVAATFGSRVCVEGVETPGMRDILQGFRVHSFQGFYYSRPLPIDSFIKWERNWGKSFKN